MAADQSQQQHTQQQQHLAQVHHTTNHEESACCSPELALWSSNTKSSYNGQVLTVEGSLGFDGLDLFRDAHIALERGSIYGLVAPNGSGKTSLVRALPSLPNFPRCQFRVEYLSSDIDANPIAIDQEGETTARDYCLGRVEQRARELNVEIERLESALETSSNDSLEELSNQLGEVYEIKDQMEVEATSRADRMFHELHFGSYPDRAFRQLSSGWKYKCQLISGLLTKPDLLIVDEPSFLDKAATAWFVSEIQQLSKSHNTMIVLISHKEELMEELSDRILYLNPASRTLTVYNCSFKEFQAAHADRVTHAKKSKEQANTAHKDAKSSLQNLRNQLHKREQNLKSTTTKNADQRFIKGKNKEAKQKADHSAAAKVKRMKKRAVEIAEQEEALRETKVVPLELDSVDTSGNDRPLIEFNDVDFRYEGSQEMLLEYVNLQITGRDKILVQGPNGQGKSTLAKLILGQLQPTNGDIRKHANCIAYFHQDALLELNSRHGGGTSVDFLRSRDENISETEARTYLGRFGLPGSIALRPVRALSAGQRVRLWLAQEFWGNKPSLLVLDEVTENLDKETTDSLLDTLNGFSASILAVSHDDYFCGLFPATQVWYVNNRRALPTFK